MAFDFKKEYKEFYMPKNKPSIVTVPKANYIAEVKAIQMKRTARIRKRLAFCIRLHTL